MQNANTGNTYEGDAVALCKKIMPKDLDVLRCTSSLILVVTWTWTPGYGQFSCTSKCRIIEAAV